MLAGRGQGVVQGRGDQHLDDRLLRPAERLGVAIGGVHVVEAGGDDDAALVVLGHGRAGQAGEARQLRQGHIHAEGA